MNRYINSNIRGKVSYGSFLAPKYFDKYSNINIDLCVKF